MAEGDAEATLEKMRPLLRPDKVAEARVVLTRTMSKIHAGPIPSAEEMEHLERVHEGAAERCFAMAEREQAHRHDCDKAIIAKEFGFRGRGQYMAMIVVALVLAVVVVLAVMGDTKSAAWLGGVTLVGLVTAFTASKHIDSKADAPPAEPASTPAPQGKSAGKTNRR